MLYFLFFLFYLFSFVFSNDQCPLPCTECPPSFYYNKGIQRKEEIDFSNDCTAKSPLDLSYEREFYLSNILCEVISSLCDGTFENPIDSFWKLLTIIFEKEEAQKYFKQRIRIFLIGSPHFILSNEELESAAAGLGLFRGFEGLVEFSPVLCSDNLCSDSNIVDVYVKTDMLQFLVSFELIIKNIRFFGNDLIFLGLTNNPCLRSQTICCPSINDCSISNKIINFNNFNDKKIDRVSFFVLKTGNLNQVPKILFANVHFINFNLIREEGWRSLLVTSNLAKNIEFYNFSIINSFFSHGIFLDVNMDNESKQINNLIIMNTILIQNYNPYNIENSNLSRLNIAFFTFQNIFGLSLNINNLLLQSIEFLNDKKYVFLIENYFNFTQQQIYLNGTKFENTSGLSFIIANSSLEININDFVFKNCSVQPDNPVFFLANHSKIIFKNALFSFSSFFNTSIFFSQQNSELILQNIYIKNALGSCFGNFSDGSVLVNSSGFEVITAEFLMMFFQSNLTLFNSTISSCIFKEAAFQFVNGVNNHFFYNQSLYTNVVAPNFFFVQQEDLSKIALTGFMMMLCDIHISNLKNSSIFLNIKNTLIEFLSLNNVKIIDCFDFSLVSLQAGFMVISLIDIYIENLNFSSFGLIQIEMSDFVSNNLTYINMTNFIIQNSVFNNNVFSFKAQNGVLCLQIQDFILNNLNAYILFGFQSTSNIEDNYKIKLSNFSIVHMKGKLTDHGLLILVNSLNSAIDFIILTNIIVENCTSISLFKLEAQFNYIALHNISISYIEENHYHLMWIVQLSSNDRHINNTNNSSLNIINFRIKCMIISVVQGVVIRTYDFPLQTYFFNLYFEKLTSLTLFFFISPPKKLIHAEVSNVEVFDIQPVFDDFFFLYLRFAAFSIISITNFHFHESDSFYLIYLLQMFDLISFKNITIFDISYSLFYLILIGQYESISSDYNRIEFYNLTFLYIDLNNDYLSPISLFFLANFEEMLMENIIIKNIRNYNLNHEMRGFSFLINFQNIKMVKVIKVRFEQNIWCTLDQLFRVNENHKFELSDSKFEIYSLENVRKFQCIFIYFTPNIAFLNNELIGMSTIEKPQFLYEEIGIAAFMTQDSYDFASKDSFFLLIKNNTFKNNFGIRYGVIGIVGFPVVEFINNTFIDNEAQYGGSLSIIAVRRLFIQNLTLINSHSRKEGGGIYILRTNLIDMIDSIFYNISSNSDAGIIYTREIYNFYANNISIKLCTAGDKGGAGYFVNTLNLTFVNFFVELARAQYGGMFYFDEKTNVFINNGNFKSGQVSISGGFAFINGDNMNILIINSLFNDFISEQDAAILSSPNIANFTLSSSAIKSSMNFKKGLGIVYLEGHSFDIQERNFNFINLEFYNTSSLYGSNIYYTSNSRLRLINITSHLNQGSLFNFESESLGHIYVESSLFTGTNSIITDLGAYSLFISSKCLIYLNQTIFVNNFGMNHMFEINADTKLTLINSAFDDYFLIKKSTLSRINTDCKYFYISKSEVNSESNRIGYKDKDLNDSFKCTNSDLKESVLVSLNDFYYNFNYENAPIYFISYKSSIYYDNIQISNVRTAKNIFSIISSSFILNNTFIKLQSTFQINTNDYYFYLDGLDSASQKNTIIINNVGLETSDINLIYMRSLYRVEISNSDFLANTSSSDLMYTRAINLYNLYFVSIFDTKFRKFFNDIGSCLYFTSDNTFLSSIRINNSIFQNNTAFSAASIYIKGNISLIISNCEFTKNNAVVDFLREVKNAGKGSCIVIDSEDYNNPSLEITNSKFISNFAEWLGPTIICKSVKKPIINNCLFYDNKDGLNFTTTFSNFPLIILLNYENSKIQLHQGIQKQIGITVVSGRPFAIYLELYDDNNNKIFVDNDSQGDILCDSNNQPIFLDKTSSKAKNGDINFENVLILTQPNSLIFCEILVRYTDSLIFQSSKGQTLSNKSNQSLTINLNMTIRKCIIGEIHQPDDSCYECPAGKYSLQDPENINLKPLKCWDCPLNAFCKGGSYITPIEGFWRSSFESTLILECPSKYGCLGIPNDKGIQGLDEEGKLHGLCGGNYFGNMCFSCKTGYARYQQFGECLECDSLYVIYIKMTFSFLFIVGYISIQVNLFTKYKEEDSHSTVLIKIFLNHLHIFTLNRLFSNRVKIDIGMYFSVEDYFSFFYQDFIKIDCLVQDIDQDLFIQDTIFTILLPIIFSLVMGIIWISAFFYLVFRKKILKFTLKNLGQYLLQKSIITIIILVFLFYAEILKKCFSMLNCIEINEVKKLSVLLLSPNVYCWDGNHEFWILTVALPGLIFWGIIAPSVMMMVLFKNKDHIYKIVYEMEIKSKRKLSKSNKTQGRSFQREIKVEIENFLAHKLFFNGMPPSKKKIRYNVLKKNYNIYQSVEIFIREKDEILKNHNISIDAFPNIDTSCIFLDKDYMVKNYNEIFEFFEEDFKPYASLTEEDLRDHFFRVEIKNEEIFEAEHIQSTSINNKIVPKKTLKSKNLSEKASFLVKNIRFILPGYTKDYFFWEIMILARKFVLTLVCSFDQLFLNQIKSALVLIILLFFLHMQMKIRPYHHVYMNNLECISLVTTFFNFAFLMGSLSETIKNYEIIVLITFLINNSIFFMVLIHYSFKFGMLKQKIVNFYKSILRKIRSLNNIQLHLSSKKKNNKKIKKIKK